jgi:hypothetical protein
MTRTYLTEDFAQIQRYFPSAEPLTITTPFDLTERPPTRRVFADVFQEPSVPTSWRVRWTI